MTSFSGIKNILWDFDGVLMDSMPIRSLGFKTVLADYPSSQVNELLDYHNRNAGLSRYVKFRYFFETIRREPISDDDLKLLTDRFSSIMLSKLTNAQLLIADSVDFVKKYHEKFKMHIVSGSDEAELRYLCGILQLSPYFKSINGSPRTKSELVAGIMFQCEYSRFQTIMIGDSTNDRDAAESNRISFVAYNNTKMKESGVAFIESFAELMLEND